MGSCGANPPPLPDWRTPRSWATAAAPEKLLSSKTIKNISHQFSSLRELEEATRTPAGQRTLDNTIDSTIVDDVIDFWTDEWIV